MHGHLNVRLINYILCSEVVLDYNFRYILLIIDNATGIPHLKTGVKRQ